MVRSFFHGSFIVLLSGVLVWADEGVQKVMEVQEGREVVGVEGRGRVPFFPHLTLRPERKCIDIKAVVCQAEAKLELLLCNSKGKVHESLLSTEARAKDIHVALLLLGAEAGSPERRVSVESGANAEAGGWMVHPPHGGELALCLVVRGREQPLGEVLVSEEGAAASTLQFLFCGSILQTHPSRGEALYMADYSGNIISLSGFGDEVIGLSTPLSREGALLDWSPRREVLALGQEVTLRVKVK